MPDVVLRAANVHKRYGELEVLKGVSFEVEWPDAAPSMAPVENPLFSAIEQACLAHLPAALPVPTICVGGTDARFFRRLGTTSYGFGLFSRKLTFEEFGRMFHGDDERVDVESLRLSTELWEAVARDLLA